MMLSAYKKSINHRTDQAGAKQLGGVLIFSSKIRNTLSCAAMTNVRCKPVTLLPRHQSSFIFYGTLTQILKNAASELAVTYRYNGHPSIKDAIEAQGIPHPEVILILRNNQRVAWSEKIGDGETYHVYPANFRLNNVELKPDIPTNGISFALDVHLGKLARYLRMLGFDTYHMNKDKGDKFLVELGCKQQRIILTRDKDLLKHSQLKYGHWLRHSNPDDQLREVVQHYQLRPSGNQFTRCLECNSMLQTIEKAQILQGLPARVKNNFNCFKQCSQCKKIYWQGSHFDNMKNTLAKILG